jgi:hypothetical protein
MKKIHLDDALLKEIVGGDASFDTAAIPSIAQSGTIPNLAQMLENPGDLGNLGKSFHDIVKGV